MFVQLEHPGLVPASLLPPEDPSARRGRTLRDWAVDVLMFALAVLIGLAVFDGARRDAVHAMSDGRQAADLLLGAVCCGTLWWRRRWPVGIAAFTTALSVVSTFGVLASLLALFTVAVHRRTVAALALAAAQVGASLLSALVLPQKTPLWQGTALAVAACAIVVAWGMFVRARRQLVWTLRERAERAEAEQHLLADQARAAERTRIAREMHDVLAHKISLLALHAGGLEMRPDLPADQVRETAQVLRSTARQALEELRGVIGVLRADTLPDAPSAPQPTLDDIPRLVAETRQAGAKIDFEMRVDDPAPAALGRDAYRIVQEALTNVAKHAPGTATQVRVGGAPGAELTVSVRNRLPVRADGPTLPGSGSGLIGLRERVELAGGSLVHGPDGTDYVVQARLPWQ